MNRSASPLSSILFRGRLFRLASQFLLLALVVAPLGCGKTNSGPKNSVTGKVMLGGKPVGGEVIFVGPDGKEMKGLIATDGTYIIPDPTPGDNDIMVKGMGMTTPPKDMMKGMQTPPASTGLPPPAKYAQRGNGLKFTVTTGQQPYNIDLLP